MKKHFSLKNKLITIFGLLITVSSAIEGVLAVRIARTAVTEKVSEHLIDKAEDSVAIIDGKVKAFWQLFGEIASAPVLFDANASYQEKAEYLTQKAKVSDIIYKLNFCDMQGIRHLEDGGTHNVSDRDYFISASRGKPFVSEPINSRLDGTLVIVFAVPVYDEHRSVIGVLMATVHGNLLSQDIDHIVVGKTGYCYVVGLTGNVIGHNKDFSLVETRWNTVEQSKRDPTMLSTAAFEKMAMGSAKPSMGYYKYKGKSKIASYAVMKTTGWTVIINAPVNEFMGTVTVLKTSMFIMGAVLLCAAFIIILIVARAIIKPIQSTVRALRNIANGRDDLTVRLPLKGSDEITDLALFFNQTIAKINASIRSVEKHAVTMKTVGDELSCNMSQSATALNQVSGNIDGVKQQAMTQAESVSRTAGTIEAIIQTIETLADSIETQSVSVSHSSASIEEMVANIASITQSLEKSDNMVRMLANATSEGKSTLLTSNTVTQKIADESGGLIEASSVIENIASQTNLLAMNAAIEAAHAGEAGKGFAVVADEIRKLAEESAMQGKTITDTLKKLSDDIKGLAASSKIVEEKFNAIFQLSENVRGMSTELTAAMKEQENGSREVLAAIKNISAVTVEVKSGSQDMLSGGKGVAQEMQKLDQLTAVIKDSMNEMAAGVGQINHAVQEVNDLARKNKDSIEGLAEEVGKFRV
ncbi:MAG: methyl-accepting chemotaxis protein [Treponema sp.]